MVKYFFSILFIVFLNIPAMADSIYSISRGGMLYDRWYQVIDAPKPESTHPAWPKSNSKLEQALIDANRAMVGITKGIMVTIQQVNI